MVGNESSDPISKESSQYCSYTPLGLLGSDLSPAAFKSNSLPFSLFSWLALTPLGFLIFIFFTKLWSRVV